MIDAAVRRVVIDAQVHLARQRVAAARIALALAFKLDCQAIRVDVTDEGAAALLSLPAADGLPLRVPIHRDALARAL